MSITDRSGTTAIVTGPSRGFGRATAIALAASGVRVVGVARGEAELAELHEQPGISFTAVLAYLAEPALAARHLFWPPARHLGAQPRRGPLGSAVGRRRRARTSARARSGGQASSLSPAKRCLLHSAPGSGGRQVLQRRSHAGVPHERRLRRSQSNDQVHELLCRSPSRTRWASGSCRSCISSRPPPTSALCTSTFTPSFRKRTTFLSSARRSPASRRQQRRRVGPHDGYSAPA
jgi:short chain dehydrogenase